MACCVCGPTPPCHLPQLSKILESSRSRKCKVSLGAIACYILEQLHQVETNADVRGRGNVPQTVKADLGDEAMAALSTLKGLEFQGKGKGRHYRDLAGRRKKVEMRRKDIDLTLKERRTWRSKASSGEGSGHASMVADVPGRNS